MELFFIVTLTKLDKNVVFCLDYLLTSAEWVILNPNSGRKSILCRWHLSADFRRQFLSSKGNHSLSWCSTVPASASEGRKEGCSRKCMACKLYLIKAVKSKKIKLPKEPKSFILQDKLSDKNIVQHSRILGVKKYDV